MNDDRNRQRTAVVTGGSSGIGLGVAQALGQKGFRVWIADRDIEKGAVVGAPEAIVPAGSSLTQPGRRV
ncbi:SDR family NAD(P)-dependent oxidoreductase [Mycobacterium sp. E1747]|uniref:SDR family NAD(P)-dependent oxidoreductase n=1 Tax=Mycobacterium sp. E1747 TaxID=1834128 RepID=UPI0007FF3D48|nr:SDR family NAD(P)-dependent oxidoreductase [Mycobacterium sp. E1747]OBH10633.1 hypothetical protein A5695_21415 [Mycobacterium sp. E1747]